MSIKLLDTIYKLTDNADKVDGKHASDFATSGHTHNLGNKNVADLSSTYPSGISIGGIYNNGYPFSYGSTITASGNGGYFQIAGQWNSNVTSSSDYDYPTEMYIRGRRDSYDVWTTWSRVLTNRNYTSFAAKHDHTHSNYASKVTVGTAAYTCSSNNITIPAYPTIPIALKCPTSLTIQLNGSSQGAWDGSADKTINITPASIGAATSGHTHNYAASDTPGGPAKLVKSHDTRSVTIAPDLYGPTLSCHFKSNGTNGVSDGGNYFGLIHFRPYGSATDFSGGYPHQIAFTENNNLWHRKATSSTAWGTWYKILDSNNSSVSKSGETLTVKINGTIQSLTNTNTTYSAGSGLSLSGTTFNHASSVTAGTAGTPSATSGSTLAVPYVTVNATGHVTGYGTHTHTVSGFLPSSGGTITGILTIKRNPSAIKYINDSDTVWGWLGFSDKNVGTLWESNGSTKHTLLHSGNYTSYAPSLNHGYGYVMKATTIDASSLNANTYYPVIIPVSPYNKASIRIEVEVSLNSGTKPSWSTHNSGFSVRKVWETNGSGWGTATVSRRVLVSTYGFASSDPVRGLGQMTNSSNEYVYVRGGGKYFFYTSHGVTPSLKTSTYTASSQSVSPTTTAPAAIGESYSYAGHTHSQYLTSMPEHTHAYLPTAGGNMTSGSRIAANGGNLYIGNSNNAGWLMVQDICSQNSAGDTYWSLRTNGTAHFTTLYLGGEQITFTT